MNSIWLEHGLSLAWAIAMTATVGSLYISEVLHYTPCNLCWYQRILMYPLAIILGIAAARKDYRIAIYVLPITSLGLLISIYHYLMEKTSWVKSTSKVCGIVPCDASHFNWFGFITIPFMAGTASLLIILLMIGIVRASRSTQR